MHDPTLTKPQPRVSRWKRHGSKAETRPAPAGARTPFWRAHGPVLLVAAVAAALRLHGLGRRLVVLDESLIFDSDTVVLPLGQYTHKIWNETTYNPGWAFVVWFMNKLCGPSAFWVRLPSALLSTLATIGVYAVARAWGLSRRASVLAGAILAVAVFQVEYGQQVLPHAALPLGTCLCLWLVTRLARAGNQDEPWKQAALLAGLIAVFGTLVFCHNSALILAPPLLLFWGWSIARPEPGTTGPSRRFSAACWAVCALALGFAAFGWFFAKVGEADRNYLRPFFLATFRESPDRVITSDVLTSMDVWYSKLRPAGDGLRVRTADVGFFAASRTLDFLYGGFKIRGEQQLTRGRLGWYLPGAMVALFAFGAVRALRGGGGPDARRWVVCFGVTLGIIIVLSGQKMFPIGGIRHLICLSPFVVLTIALSFDQKAQWLARGCLALGLLWIVGDVSRLPRYYRTTRDNFGAHRLQGFAQQYGVRDVVAGDTLCSEGALRLLAAGPDTRMLPSDHPDFIKVLKEHRPFLLCSLHDPLLEVQGKEAHPNGFFKSLAHPLLSLSRYTVTPLVQSHRPIAWLDWSVYLLEPKPGPHPPEVAEIQRYKGPGDVMPRTIAIKLTRPVKPENVNEQTVRLSPQDPRGGWDEPPVPARVEYLPETQTVLLTPRLDPPVKNYMLTIERTLQDADGRKLDADGKAFYYMMPVVQVSRAEAWMVK